MDVSGWFQSASVVGHESSHGTVLLSVCASVLVLQRNRQVSSFLGEPGWRSLRALVPALAATTLAVGISACGSGPSPDPVAGAFLSDWASARYERAAPLTDGGRPAVAAALAAFADGLNASHLSLRLLGVTSGGERATARFRALVTLAGIGRWSFTGALPLRRRGGRWLVHWRSSDLDPALASGDRLIAVRTLPPRAPLLDRNGVLVQKATPVVTVGVVPALLRPRRQVIATLARVLGIDGGALAKTVAHTPQHEFVPVITLRRTAYERVKPIIYPLVGVHFQTGVLPLGPTPGFGRALLGEVGPATAQALPAAGPLALPSDQIGLSGLQFVYQRRLAGTPGGRVEVVAPSGSPVATLFSTSARRGVPVRTTLDLGLQTAAERALPQSSAPAGLIALQASTGQILAVATRPALSTYDYALESAYPPGSTFKVISTAALLERGLAPASKVPCPSSITVSGKRFTNYAGESLPQGTLLEDFAQSCNDAFISLAPRLHGSDLVAAARQFGFGARWSLPLGYYSGQARPPASPIEQAADMIGQGRILASPLNMALVAAAVDGGAWHPPSLTIDPGVPPVAAPRPLPAGIDAELRTLLRAVVTRGTGTAANLPGAPVYGKTGTAEYSSGSPPPTDAWFIGFRGDLAFAVVLQGGGVGGQAAAPIAARFLRTIP